VARPAVDPDYQALEDEVAAGRVQETDLNDAGHLTLALGRKRIRFEDLNDEELATLATARGPRGLQVAPAPIARERTPPKPDVAAPPLRPQTPGEELDAPPLPGQDEAGFQRWYSGHAKTWGLSANPDDPEHHYDYRAAFRSGAKPDASGHWPSTFKGAGHENLIIEGRDTRTGQPVGVPSAPPDLLPEAGPSVPTAAQHAKPFTAGEAGPDLPRKTGLPLPVTTPPAPGFLETMVRALAEEGPMSLLADAILQVSGATRGGEILQEMVEQGLTPEQVAVRHPELLATLAAFGMRRSPGINMEYGRSLAQRTPLERRIAPSPAERRATRIDDLLADPSTPLEQVEAMLTSPSSTIRGAATRAMKRRQATATTQEAAPAPPVAPETPPPAPPVAEPVVPPPVPPDATLGAVAGRAPRIRQRLERITTERLQPFSQHKDPVIAQIAQQLLQERAQAVPPEPAPQPREPIAAPAVPEGGAIPTETAPLTPPPGDRVSSQIPTPSADVLEVPATIDVSPPTPEHVIYVTPEVAEQIRQDGTPLAVMAKNDYVTEPKPGFVPVELWPDRFEIGTPVAGPTSPTVDDTTHLAAARAAWRDGRAYLDNAGNYRLRTEQMTTAKGTEFVGKGPVAPWNRLVKAQYGLDLHQASQTEMTPAPSSVSTGEPAPASARQVLDGQPPLVPEAPETILSDTEKAQTKMRQIEKEIASAQTEKGRRRRGSKARTAAEVTIRTLEEQRTIAEYQLARPQALDTVRNLDATIRGLEPLPADAPSVAHDLDAEMARALVDLRASLTTARESKVREYQGKLSHPEAQHATERWKAVNSLAQWIVNLAGARARTMAIRPAEGHSPEAIFQRGALSAQVQRGDDAASLRYNQVLQGFSALLASRGIPATALEIANVWHDPLASYNLETPLPTMLEGLERQAVSRVIALHRDWQAKRLLENTFDTEMSLRTSSGALSKTRQDWRDLAGQIEAGLVATESRHGVDTFGSRLAQRRTLAAGLTRMADQLEALTQDRAPVVTVGPDFTAQPPGMGRSAVEALRADAQALRERADALEQEARTRLAEAIEKGQPPDPETLRQQALHPMQADQDARRLFEEVGEADIVALSGLDEETVQAHLTNETAYFTKRGRAVIRDLGVARARAAVAVLTSEDGVPIPYAIPARKMDLPKSWAGDRLYRATMPDGRPAWSTGHILEFAEPPRSVIPKELPTEERSMVAGFLQVTKGAATGPLARLTPVGSIAGVGRRGTPTLYLAAEDGGWIGVNEHFLNHFLGRYPKAVLLQNMKRDPKGDATSAILVAVKTAPGITEIHGLIMPIRLGGEVPPGIEALRPAAPSVVPAPARSPRPSRGGSRTPAFSPQTELPGLPPPKAMLEGRPIEEMSQAEYEAAVEQARPPVFDIESWSEEARQTALGTDLFSGMRVEGPTGETRAVASMDPRLLQVLGGNLYTGDLGQVATKEMIQNAVDSVRGLKVPQVGTIHVRVDPNERSISVVDTGVGMTPEVATKELVDIGGSQKIEGSSGGFGIAKVAIFANAQAIEVVTTAKRSDGTHVTTTLTGSGDDWMDPAVGLQVSIRESSATPIGTAMTIVLKQEVKFNEYETGHWLEQFLGRSLLPLTIRAVHKGNPVPVKRPALRLARTLEIPGATMDVHVSDTMQRGSNVDVAVLNNGLYQFGKTVWLDSTVNLPTVVVIDVHAKDTPDAPNYPYRPDRQGLRSGADSAVNEYVRLELFGDAMDREVASLTKSLSDAPVLIGTTHQVFDTTQVLSRELLDRLASDQRLASLSLEIERAFSDMMARLDDLGQKVGRLRYGGIGLGDGYLGINLKLEKLFPHGTSNLMLVNPYLTIEEVLERMAGEPTYPGEVARQIVSTVLHEIAHQAARSHDEKFAGVLTRYLGMTLMDLTAAAGRVEVILRAPAAGGIEETTLEHFVRTLSDDLRPKWRQARDVFGDIGTQRARDDEEGRPRRRLPAASTSPARGDRPEGVVPGRGVGEAGAVAPGAAVGGRGPTEPELHPLATDPHYRAVRDALRTGRLTPERARALGHFDAYPDLEALAPPPLSSPAPPPAGQPLAAQSHTPQEPGYVPPGEPGAQPPEIVKARKDIIELLSNALARPVRVGHFRNALGIFKVGPEIVRTQQANDLETVAHEMGHLLQKYLFPKGVRGQGEGQSFVAAVLRQWRKELIPLAYPGAKVKSIEGFAEFVRYYLTQPEVAQQKAPGFFVEFERRLGEQDPVIRDGLMQFRKDFTDWNTATPLARGQALISYDSERLRFPGWQRSWEQFYAAAFDMLSPIRFSTERMTGGQKLPAHLDPYVLARLTKGNQGKADAFLRYNTFDITTRQPNGEPLGAVLRDVGDVLRATGRSLKAWDTYLVARRTLVDLVGRRRLKSLSATGHGALPTLSPSGMSVSDASAITSMFPDFEPLAVRFSAYADRLLQVMVGSFLNPERYLTIRAMNRAYAPFYRLMENQEASFGGRMDRRFANLAQPIKKLVGSQKEILSPTETMIRNTYAFLNLVENNRVISALADLAETTPGSAIVMDKVPWPEKMTTFELGEIRKVLKDAGLELDEETAQYVARIFRPAPVLPSGERLVYRWKQGDKQAWQVMERELYRALMNLGPHQFTLLVKFFAIPARMLRAGVAMNPAYGGRNFGKDQVAALIQSEAGSMPLGDWGQGIFAVVNATPLYVEFLASGAAQSILTGLERAGIQRSVAELMRSKLDSRTRMILNPIHLARTINEISEQATRVGGEYRRSRKAGESVEESAIRAREGLQDFARMGWLIPPINLIVAYFAPWLGGLDKAVRTAWTRPVRFWTYMAALMTTSLLLYLFVNRGKQAYHDTPQGIRDSSWLIIYGEDEHTKINLVPKPWDYGPLFASGTERILEWIDGKNPEILNSLTKTLQQSFTHNVIPQAVLGPLENAMNWSFAFERPVVSGRYARLDPAFQTQPGTSPSMASMAHGLGALGAGQMPFVGRQLTSPTQLQHLLQGYFGATPKLARKMADIVMREAGLLKGAQDVGGSRIEDWPVIGEFFARYPSLNAAPLTRVYRHWEQASHAHDTYTYLRKSGRVPEAQAFRKANAYRFRDYAILKPFIQGNDAISGLQKMRARVEVLSNSEIPADQKRGLLDQQYFRMIGVAREALAVMDRSPVISIEGVKR